MVTDFNLIETHVQSEEYTETSDTSTDLSKQQQIVFSDAHLSQRINYGDVSDDSFKQDTDSTASLANFLSRPVKIASFTWDLNNASYTTPDLQPWYLYFNHPVIKNKIQNYARLQANLQIKVIVNATPFYYGSLRLIYQPLADARSTYVQSNDQVPLSQLPGFYIEPQNMTTAEMSLPFFWPANWLDIGVAQRLKDMGKITFNQYSKLRSANGTGSAGITIAIFAWATEVELAGPTYGQVLQADEYEEEGGTISGPATAIAGVASKLQNVPMIGSMATATAMGASAVSGIAKLFGYSNPPMIDDVLPYQPKTFHAFANVETRMPIDKLAVDPKNEVSISSAIAGLDEDDPLAFKNLLTKESFLQGTLYDSASPEETLLWSCLVSPAYMVTGAAYATTTPLGYVSNMFRFWRGSIIYKFRIIKTQYHKGRLTISWDPNKDITGDTDSDSATFTRIVDLETESEVEIEVPYRGSTPYLYCTQNADFSNGTTPSYTLNKTWHNGCLTVRVQNVLTGPTVSPQIDILVYQRAGDDFIFAAPDNIYQKYSLYDPLGVIQSDNYTEVNADANLAQEKSTYDEKVAMVTTGENIVSLRPILHRTTLSTRQILGDYRTANGNTAAGNQDTVNLFWRIPRGMGRSPDGYTVASGPPNYNYFYCVNHPIDWVLNMFAGYRGSVNVHVNTQNGFVSNCSPISALTLSRHYERVVINTGAAEIFTNALTAQSAFLQGGNVSRNVCTSITTTSGVDMPRFESGMRGLTLTNPGGQPAVSANFPQYQKNRFYPAFHNRRTYDFATGGNFFDEIKLCASFQAASAPAVSNPYPTCTIYYSAGVDFQPLFFMCTPRIWTVASPPAAVTNP